jgi:hypothetical protein
MCPLVDDRPIDARAGPVAMQLGGRVEEELFRIRLEENLVQRAAVLVHHVCFE